MRTGAQTFVGNISTTTIEFTNSVDYNIAAQPVVREYTFNGTADSGDSEGAFFPDATDPANLYRMLRVTNITTSFTLKVRGAGNSNQICFGGDRHPAPLRYLHPGTSLLFVCYGGLWQAIDGENAGAY